MTKEFKQKEQEYKKYMNCNRKMKNQSTIKQVKYMSQYLKSQNHHLKMILFFVLKM